MCLRIRGKPCTMKIVYNKNWREYIDEITRNGKD